MKQLKYVNVKEFKNNKIGIKKELALRDKVVRMEITELVAFDKFMKPLNSHKCSLKYFSIPEGKYNYYDLDAVTYVGLLCYEVDKSTFQVYYDSVELTIGMLNGFDTVKHRIIVKSLKNINHNAYSKVFEYILSESLSGCKTLNLK